MPRKANARSPQGSGTVRQRPDGRWEARYVAGHDTGTGKQIRRSIYGTTQKEVLLKLQKVQTQLEEGTYSTPQKITVAGWLDIWLKEYTGGVKELTLVTYTTQVEQHIKPALGAVKLSALTTPAIQKFYNALSRGEDGAAQLSAKTIRNIHGVFHKALSTAVRVGYLRFNVTDNVTLPRTEKAPIQPITDENIARFLEAIKGQPFELLFTVDLFTGMRKGELLGLTWDCVDFERGTILIDKQLIQEKKKGGCYKFAPCKNDKSRTLSPAPSVMQLLVTQRRTQAKWKLKAGTAWVNQLNLVFTNELGGNLSHTTVSHTFKRTVDKLGLEGTRFHDLRHSFAVASLESGDDIKTVQENLGHHTAAFTLDVYGHVSEKMKRDSAARMEQFIKSIGK